MRGCYQLALATYPNICDETVTADQTAMFLYGFAPDGVYPASAVTSPAVRSYRTFSPLPETCLRWFVFCGTFPKVALAGRYPAS